MPCKLGPCKRSFSTVGSVSTAAFNIRTRPDLRAITDVGAMPTFGVKQAATTYTNAHTHTDAQAQREDGYEPIIFRGQLGLPRASPLSLVSSVPTATQAPHLATAPAI